MDSYVCLAHEQRLKALAFLAMLCSLGHLTVSVPQAKSPRRLASLPLLCILYFA
jgi:hypothetical protein